MSFIAQDFEKLDIITVLEGRTQAIIRNHFLRYDRVVRCRVKIITMDMFSPYYVPNFKLKLATQKKFTWRLVVQAFFRVVVNPIFDKSYFFRSRFLGSFR
ncbi:transposase [Streptococcus pneumoniae]|uniref:Transposase n=1 Tax=Streptococcus pneumoniae TaxID=1313 RepID=A0AAX3HEL0_STREE|nr:transposase [Streptococcus pneumoniae]